MDNKNLMDEISQLEKELKKTLNFGLGQLSDIAKKTDIIEEKKCVINKKPCTAVLSVGGIMLIFDNANDRVVFFDEIKRNGRTK